MIYINFIRLWYFFCIILMIVNLDLLVHDSYQVEYIEKDLKENELTINYWICTKFKELKDKSNGEFLSEKLRNQLNSTTKIVKIKDLLNNTIVYLKKITPKFKFKLNETHLFNRQFCFLVQTRDFNEKLDEYLNKFDIRLYAFSSDILPLAYRNIYLKKSFYKMNNLRSHQQKIMNENNAHLECLSKESKLPNSNYECLKDCLTSLNSFNDVYFDFSDINQDIDLNLIFFKNQNLKNKNEKQNCLFKCKTSSCFWETINTITVNLTENETKFYNAQLLIETSPLLLEFWLQFFGLFTLFTSTSFVSSLSIFLLYSAKKLKKEEEFKRYYLYAKLLIIISSLAFLISKSSQFIDDYNRSYYYPNKTMNLNFSLEPSTYSVVICVPIQFLILNQELPDEKEDLRIIKDKKFGEIENLTNNGLEKVIDGMYLKYGDERRDFKYEISKKIIFRNSKSYKGQNNNFQRCFRINMIEIDLVRYESMMTIANLLIVFKNEFYELFIIDNDLDISEADLNYQIGEFKISSYFRHKSPNSLKSNCEDYFLNDVCKTKKRCLEKCYSKLFANYYNNSKLTINTLVDKDDFKNLDSKFDVIKLNSIRNINDYYFSNEFNLELEKICEEKFKKENCISIKFNPTFKRGMNKDFNKLEIEIELYYEKEVEADIVLISTGVSLNILNLESLLFGSNVSSSIIALFTILKSIFKFKWYSIYGYLIYLICLIGFLTHIFFILEEIFTEVLVDTGYFQRIEKLQMPNLIFCFQFHLAELDSNYLRNGKYLDQFTSNLTFSKIFDKIIYFNKEKFVNLNFSSINFINNSILIDKEYENEEIINKSVDKIILNYFFWKNQLKCFEIDNRLVYNEKDFYFRKDIYSLKLYFNSNFKNQNLFFFYKNKQSKQLIEIYRFNLTDLKYKIKLEQFEILVEDKLELLKNPSRILFKENHINDGSLYLKQMKSEFKNKYNLSTLSIPLGFNDFKYELNEQLFQQYYYQIQEPIDKKLPSSINSKRTIYNVYEQHLMIQNSTNTTNLDDEPDFLFGIDFQIRIVKVTNKLNLAKLVQNLLNSCSLWLDLCILEFYKYFNLVSLFFKFIYKLLIHLRNLTKPDL